jgi:hypothetical protein
VFNSGETDVTATIKTSLPAGTYTDRIGGGSVAVGADGMMTVDVKSWNAVAIDVKSKN